MSKQKILVAITRHEQLIHRAKQMIAAGSAGRSLPEDAQFHQRELEDFDNAMADLIIEVTAETPSEAVWLRPGSFAFRNQPSGDKWEIYGWLKTYRRGLEISRGYFQSLLALYSEELHVGDKITVGKAHVVMGSNASAGNISTHGQVSGTSLPVQDLSKLADELALLRQAMKQEGTLPEHDIALGAVAAAERATREGDTASAASHLKSAGRWCLDIAGKIGVSVASEAIKSALSIGKGAA